MLHYLSKRSSSQALWSNGSVQDLGIASSPSLHPSKAPATAALASASPPWNTNVQYMVKQIKHSTYGWKYREHTLGYHLYDHLRIWRWNWQKKGSVTKCSWNKIEWLSFILSFIYYSYTPLSTLQLTVQFKTRLLTCTANEFVDFKDNCSVQTNI